MVTTHPSSHFQAPTLYLPIINKKSVKKARKGFAMTNCRVPCLHLRRKKPSTGIGFRQQLHRIHDFLMILPSLWTTTAPGPPTYAKHRAMKL